LVAAVIRHAGGPRGWQCRDRGGRQPPRQNRIGAWTGGDQDQKVFLAFAAITPPNNDGIW